MRTILRRGGSVGRSLIVTAGLIAVSCQTTPQATRTLNAAPTRLTTQEIQAEIMAFADSYTGLIDEAADRIADAMPARRASIHRLKLRNVQSTIIIAAGPNPVGGLLDMTVMVTLQRQAAEGHMTEQYGAEVKPLVEVLKILERDIWAIARRALDEQQIMALDALIRQIPERYPSVIDPSSIRASDYADSRLSTVVEIKGGGSLLQLFHLDPLANLSPASQELAQTRLLAERAFFWANRMPLILNWQIQDVVMDSLAQPESQELLTATSRLVEAGERLSMSSEKLVELLPQERSAAIEQLTSQITVEREAAIEQILAGIAAEREAVLRTFEDEEVRSRGLLEDVRLTTEAATVLIASLNETFASEGQPFNIADYKATAESTTVAVQEMKRLIESLDELLASSNWDARNAQLRTAATGVRASLEGLIDRLFQRGLVLILVFVGLILVTMVFYRRIIGRFTPALSGRTGSSSEHDPDRV
ncbi:MAG: hypothetical protein V3T84_11750 [Phycisphaerales bacterium]